MDGTKISIVVPCYNEEATIPIFIEEAQRVVAKMGVVAEYIFVDDGSSDATLSVLKDLSAKDSSIHYISFSRNFGKEAALYAGIEKSRGEYTAVMDADMQDPPSLLPEMYKTLVEDGYDCAATRRVTRKNEPPIRSFFARLFYKIMSKMSDVQVVDGARDFRLMNRKFVNALLSLQEKNRFSKGLFPWVGFKTKWFEYENRERVAGETKWSFWKLFLYSIDGLIGFSTKPLAFSAAMGVFSIFISVLLIVILVIRKLTFNNSIEGWASLICVILFATGLQLLSTGIIGLYLSKIYTETKKRPIYIISEEK